MLAILYLALTIYFGDRISRHFFRFVSLPHRLATSFLVGLVLATFITYLGTLFFSNLSQPLLMGNVVFLEVCAAVIYWVPRRPDSVDTGRMTFSYSRWDWVLLLALLVFCCWLMFATLSFSDGKFLIAFKGWTDFGANVSLLQSFVFGHNFPTEHPFFPGEPIRYHFLFWLQTANFAYLGLNPVWAINLLSILSLFSLLILIRTFAEILFDSKAAGRIAPILFLFSSALYYLPFLRSQQSLSGVFSSIINMREFLPSGYPWRGENWGVLTISVFGNQRHLISGIAIVLVVLIFLVERYKAAPKFTPGVDPTRLNASIFSGLLLGLLPFWNSPTYISALAIIGCLFILFPYRKYLVVLLVTAVIIGMPQVFLFKPRTLDQPFFRWGYTMDNPTVFQVFKYLGWSFGLKWLLILLALIWLSKLQRKLFLAVSSLLVLVFFFQLSTDVFNNHKLLNIWAIFASIYAAYGLWLIAKRGKPGVVLASLLGLATIFGGLVDLFPLQNDAVLTVPYKRDRLTDWLLANTKPNDVFLSQTYLTHPILFTGRKIFLGNTLYAWSAGYSVPDRERIYRRMFQEQNPVTLLSLLREQNISYVAIDSGVRSNQAIKDLNEWVYQRHFEKVFEDTERKYDFVTIYRVPALGDVMVRSTGGP